MAGIPSLGNYAQLVTDIPSYIENATPELAAVIPSIIANSQARMLRDLSVQAQMITVTGTLSTSVNTFSRPADLLSPGILTLRSVGSSTGDSNPLQFKMLGYLKQGWTQAAAAQPIYYGFADATNYTATNTTGMSYIVCAIPDLPYPYDFTYKRYLPLVTAINANNWLTDYAYDALLAACLSDAARFTIDDRRDSLISVWEAKYQTLMQGINAAEIRSERDDFRVPTLAAENRATPSAPAFPPGRQ